MLSRKKVTKNVSISRTDLAVLVSISNQWLFGMQEVRRRITDFYIPQDQEIARCQRVLIKLREGIL